MKTTSEFCFDHAAQEIIISAAFDKAASKMGSPEYKNLIKLRKDFPDYKIVRKTIRTSEKKRNYKGLSYERMEAYIITNFSKDGVEFTAYTKARALANLTNAPYGYMKKWFLKNYPEYNGNNDTIENDNVETVKAVGC